MKSWRTLTTSLVLVLSPTLTHAVPVEYRFDLTITELGTGGSSLPPDPYYSNFAVGQTFSGTFTWDPDAAVEVFPGSGAYYGTFQYSVQIGDARVYSGELGDGVARPRVSLIDAAAGAGSDNFLMFDEVPLHEGTFGNSDGYVEQFYFNLENPSGTAFDGTVPGAIDFASFTGSLFNFWWQPDDGPGSPGYARLLIYGTVGNIQEVPVPGALGLMLAGGAAWFAARRLRRPRPAAGAGALETPHA